MRLSCLVLNYVAKNIERKGNDISRELECDLNERNKREKLKTCTCNEIYWYFKHKLILNFISFAYMDDLFQKLLLSWKNLFRLKKPTRQFIRLCYKIKNKSEPK